MSSNVQLIVEGYWSGFWPAGTFESVTPTECVDKLYELEGTVLQYCTEENGWDGACNVWTNDKTEVIN